MNDVKDFYSTYADRILEKRFHSPFPIRQYAHRAQYDAILRHVRKEETVLDAGCGEGVISLLLAEAGIASTGADLSLPNVRAQTAAKEKELNLSQRFCKETRNIYHSETIVDTVTSSHVLEHLPSFDQGWKELCRTEKRLFRVADKQVQCSRVIRR